MTSPTAGKPDWHLTMRAGSHFAPALPPMMSYFWLDITAAVSPPVFLETEVMTYLQVEPARASRRCISSGVLRLITLFSLMSRTVKVKPSSMAGSQMSPAVLNGSANILYRGRFQAPVLVLFARNTTTGSLERSMNSSSATPGPRHLRLPPCPLPSLTVLSRCQRPPDGCLHGRQARPHPL